MKDEAITIENWRKHLDRGRFSQYGKFFDDWTRQSSIEAVLKESVPVLMKGVSSVAYHALLCLGYALDCASKEEVAFSLAYWASAFYPSPDFDTKSPSLEPDAFFAGIVRSASTLHIKQTAGGRRFKSSRPDFHSLVYGD